MLLAKFLNRRIFSDFLENQIDCGDVTVYLEMCRTGVEGKNREEQEARNFSEKRILHEIPKFFLNQSVSDKN